MGHLITQMHLPRASSTSNRSDRVVYRTTKESPGRIILVLPTAWTKEWVYFFFWPCVFEITLNPNWARYFGWWCKAYKVNRLTCDLYNVGWSCWRVLRRGWPCQIWPPNGLHHNNAIMECDRIRRADRGGRGVWPCLGGNQMGDWLFHQSPYTPKCALGWGTQHPTIFNSNTLEQGSIRFVHIIHSWSSQVGDGDTDHYCWQRPEDMTTSRQAYKIDAENPGSDLAGETAAAMAAASIVFRSSNPHYSHLLLHHAQQVSVWKFPSFFFLKPCDCCNEHLLTMLGTFIFYRILIE